MTRPIAALCALVLLALTGTARSEDEFGWILSLPGVSPGAIQSGTNSFQAVYEVDDMASALDRVKHGLVQRGWQIAQQGSATAGGLSMEGFEARKGARKAVVSVQTALGHRVLALNVKGGSGSLETGGSGAGGRSSGGATAGARLIINDNGVVRTYACQGTEVIINGNSCDLTLTGSCEDLIVNGNENKVRSAGSIADIIVNGNHNAVNWAHATNPNQPDVSDNGSGNSLSGY